MKWKVMMMKLMQMTQMMIQTTLQMTQIVMPMPTMTVISHMMTAVTWKKNLDLITDTQDQQPLEDQTFLGDLFQSLHELKRGKIDWSDLDVDDLVNKYLKKPAECMKMVHDELNLVGNLIQTYTRIKVMNMSDTKPIKINKIVTSMQTSSDELITQTFKRNKVKTLQQIVRVKHMDPTYPKVYLQIVIANSLLETAATNWVNKSPIPMEINVDADDCGDFFTHTCHSFPEFIDQRP